MAVKVILEVQAKPGTGDKVVALFRSILPVPMRCKTVTIPTMMILKV